MKCHHCGTETELVFCHCCGTRQQPKIEEKPDPRPADNLAEAAPRPADALAEALAVEIGEPAGRWNTFEAPRIQLPTGRSLWKMLFLGILTLGIYPTVIWSRIVTELNIAASRHDGERTMPYFAMLLLSPLTLGIYTLVWFHDFCRRIGWELERRGLEPFFGAKDFWLWNLLGSLILGGPFVFLHKLMKAMNQINDDYNGNG